MKHGNMKKTLFALLLALSLGACTNNNEAERILHSQGYTDITYTGYAFFACSDDDTIHTGFEATSISGDRVEGAVCCGLLFKNCTVRVR